MKERWSWVWSNLSKEQKSATSGSPEKKKVKRREKTTPLQGFRKVRSRANACLALRENLPLSKGFSKRHLWPTQEELNISNHTIRTQLNLCCFLNDLQNVIRVWFIIPYQWADMERLRFYKAVSYDEASTKI